MSEVEGYCDPRFTAVRDLLADNLHTGEDLGASVAVMLGDEMVVDLWGGYADTERTAPWTSDTITNVWSTTKTMAALSLLVLVERGLIDLDAPVATYWPEFAAAGKEQVLIRHIMSHTSGLSGWDAPVAPEDILDWERSTAMLAAMSPWWSPGSASGYHLVSQGHLIGEVVRRVDGRTIGRFFAEEIAGPLEADFHIGVPADAVARISNVVPPPPQQMDISSLEAPEIAIKSFTGPLLPGAQFSWTPEWRHAEVPAANGHGNARAVARIQSVVANGGSSNGVQLLSSATISQIFREQSSGNDLVLGLPLRFGIGYGLHSPGAFAAMPADGTCFWCGWGGSIVIVDTVRRLTISYVMNKMASGLVADPRGEGICRAVYQSLGITV